jgi:hypothetical protein
MLTGQGASSKKRRGIVLPVPSFKLWQVYRFHDQTGRNNEFQAIFVVNWPGTPNDVHPDKQEVEQVAWKDLNEVVHTIKIKSGWTCCGYELTLLDTLAVSP